MIDSTISGFANRLNDLPLEFSHGRSLIKRVPSISNYDLNCGEVVYAARENQYYFGKLHEDFVTVGGAVECCPILLQDPNNYNPQDGDPPLFHDDKGDLYYIDGNGVIHQVGGDEIFESAGSIYTELSGINYPLSGRSMTRIGHTQGDFGQVIATSGLNTVAMPSNYGDNWDDYPTPHTGDVGDTIITPSTPALATGVLKPVYIIEGRVNFEGNSWGEVRLRITINGSLAGGQTAFHYPFRGHPLVMVSTVMILSLDPGLTYGLVLENQTNGGIIHLASLAVSLIGR